MTDIEKAWRTKAGLRAFVRMGTVGFRCGYVGVTKAHALFGADYIEAKIGLSVPDVPHGGLTFSGAYPPVAGDGVWCNDVWWFGFDCGHYGDLKIWEDPSHFRRGMTHKTLDFCVNECEKLARGLKELEGAEK